MNGRIENEIKIESAIQNILEDTPEYLTEWFYYLKASQKTAATCRDFITKIKRLMLFINKDIKNISVDDFNPTNITRYYISIQTKEDSNGNIISTSDSYQQTVWCCMNNFFDFLYKRGYIKENYMNLINKPKNRDLDRINEHRVLLTEDDFKNILKSVNNGVGNQLSKSKQASLKERDLAIVTLFMVTGMRKTALASINIEDLDLDNGRLYVIDKGNKRHTYVLSKSTIDCLNKWIAKRNNIANCDALFVKSTGTRLSGAAIEDLVDKYCTDALGYHISPHKLRSGFASIMYNKTGDIEFVRRTIGHSNVATTQRYIVTNDSEKEVAASIMENILCN